MDEDEFTLALREFMSKETNALGSRWENDGIMDAMMNAEETPVTNTPNMATWSPNSKQYLDELLEEITKTHILLLLQLK